MPEEGAPIDPAVIKEKDAEIAALQEKLAAESKLLTEMKDRYLRSLADGENVRNRAKRELEDSKVFSIQSFAKVTLQTNLLSI